MMRIAQVAPLWENIPPQHYGGTERIVHFLTEKLVSYGHEVTLFATQAAQTSAKLSALLPSPLHASNVPWTNLMYPLLHITNVFDHADEFDIIHVHLNKASDYLALPLAEKIARKVVFTIHFPYPTQQQRDDRHQVFQKYKKLQYISISHSQRKGGENLNWIANVYNGINLDPYVFQPEPKDYFFWLGKFNPDKGVLEAILAAKEAGAILLLGGAIDNLENEDRDYFQQKIKPLIDEKNIVYVGELNNGEKSKYLGEAQGFLNPLQWEEPFGLTMVESMACGTPVIATNRGAAPELIINNKTGFVVDTVSEMVQKIKEIKLIDRAACRQRVEAFFTDEVMAREYEKAYQVLV